MMSGMRILKEFFESQQRSDINRTSSPAMDENAPETQYARGRRKAISASVVTEEQAASYTKTVTSRLRKLQCGTTYLCRLSQKILRLPRP